jgi:hypothetical protein
MGSLFGGGGGDIPMPTDIFEVNKKTGKDLTGGQITGVERYYQNALPAFLGLQGQYTPQFMQQGFGFGGQALTGLMGLQQQAGMGAAQQMADLRAQELGDMTGQTSMFRNLAGALSPEQAAMVQASQDEANRATASAQGVTPQEQRMYQQTAREAAQASGRLGGNAAIASEVMGRENVLAQKRAEAAGARERAFSQAGSFYTAPGLSMLGATPASYSAGTSLAGTGLGLGQSMGPELDYNLPLTLARERAGALDARNMAQYEADQKAKAAKMGTIGSLVGLAAIPFTGGLSAGLGLTGLAGGAAGASGMSGLGLSAGMGLKSMFGGIPRATPV